MQEGLGIQEKEFRPNRKTIDTNTIITLNVNELNDPSKRLLDSILKACKLFMRHIYNIRIHKGKQMKKIIHVNTNQKRAIYLN